MTQVVKVELETRGESSASAISYAGAKFGDAVHALAIGKGRIKERLHDAAVVLQPVREGDLPEDLRPCFRWIKEELTKREPRQRAVIEGRIVEGVEGRLGATLRTMRVADAVLLAEQICDLHYKLEGRLRSASVIWMRDIRLIL